MLASYRASWLRRDVVAGLVLTTLLVPQGMAYAQLAGLPAITGLYTSVLCLIGYAAFGPSRILVLGPDSSLGPMIAATILPIIGSGGDPSARSRWRRCWPAGGRHHDRCRVEASSSPTFFRGRRRSDT
jgi:MFS superfamily sulfate permease-like transporter